MLQQECHHLIITTLRCQVQRRRAIVLDSVHVGISAFNKQLSRRDFTLPRGLVQGRVSVLHSSRRVSAGLKKRGHNIGTALPCCVVERCRSVPAQAVQIQLASTRACSRASFRGISGCVLCQKHTNDVEMLEHATHGVIVRNDHGTPLPRLAGEETGAIRRTAQTGPTGWNAAVLALLQDLGATTG